MWFWEANHEARGREERSEESIPEQLASQNHTP
jgi:hypothetical protein